MKKYKNAEWLYEHYIEKEMTQQEMADKIGCGQHTISKYLRKNDIETRDRTDYVKHPKPMWHPKGYIEFIHNYNGERYRFYHHRLLAVAKEGFDAVKDKDVHHKNGIGWDNRPSNIEVKDSSDHYSEHRKEEIENGRDLEERFS